MCVCVSVFPHAHVHACLCGRPPSPRSERCLCLPLTSVQRSPVPGADSCRQPLPVCSSHLAECGCVCMLVQPLSDCQARGDFLAALVHVASADAMGTLLPPHSSAPVLNTADPPGAHGAETPGGLPSDCHQSRGNEAFPKNVLSSGNRLLLTCDNQLRNSEPK